MRTAVFYLTNEEIERLDEIRGLIPRSRMGAIAIRRLIADIENGRHNLLPEMVVVAAMGGNDKENASDK